MSIREDVTTPLENLNLEGLDYYVDQLFGDVDFAPSEKTAAQYVELVPGDHIAVEFKATENVSPWHHGIFVGKTVNGHEYRGNMVVDTSKTSKKPAVTSLQKFGGNNLIFRIDYEHDKLRKKERCQRAYIRAGWALKNPDEFEYDLLKNNCQHFATWCSTRAKRQVHVDSLPHYTSDYYRDKTDCLFGRQRVLQVRTNEQSPF